MGTSGFTAFFALTCDRFYFPGHRFKILLFIVFALIRLPHAAILLSTLFVYRNCSPDPLPEGKFNVSALRLSFLTLVIFVCIYIL